MSWQDYVDTSLIGTGTVTRAAIHGLDGNPWATSKGFSVTPAEAKTIIAGMAEAAPSQQVNGIRAGGEKYTFIRKVDTTMNGKKGSEAGIVIEKTEQAVIIAVFEGGIQAGACSATVGKLGDYLRGQGY
eukprot:m.160554 g.160554  ORF g.160554 m.160554 type:complete len:129 (-) comp11959_c0_seq1:126-512(-)